MWLRFWKWLNPTKDLTKVESCKLYHKEDHFCLDDMCSPVLPGDCCWRCNACGRCWKTRNNRHFIMDTEPQDYLETRIKGEYTSDGTYTEEDENGVTVTRSQPFPINRRK